MSDLEFRLYDTMTKTVKPLVTQEPKHLTFYCCGPTVYSYAHIGNYRTFLAADLVVRTAEALGWKVTYVSNITDVGHLTQDDVADAAGEDKMAKALHSKEGESFANIWDLARFYADVFIADCHKLNLREPAVRPRATDHMREQIHAIEELVATGHAYETDSGVYFRVSSFEQYGMLSGNKDRQNLQVGVRDVVQDPDKENPADFALWKKDSKHLMQWLSPWGWGFPGWHIECSVMAKKYLGETIDLHGGGEDLKFPHHECEIAQAESISHKTFSNHWMHVSFLQVEGEKMSKSKGTFYTLRDLLEMGYSPLAVRLALISVPYNKPSNFTLQNLKDAQGHIDRVEEIERRICASKADLHSSAQMEVCQELESLYQGALSAMADNLNTSVALAQFLEGVKMILREPEFSPELADGAAKFLTSFNGLLGIVESDYELDTDCDQEDDPVIDGKPVSAWIVERAEAKAARDFERSDAIRDQLASKKIELRDTPEGTQWKRMSG